MAPPSVGKPVRVRTEKAAAAFADPRRRRLMFELMRGECALQDLARAADMGLSLALYHVRRLAVLGLVREVRRKRRAGRPVRIYAATAAAFFVPAVLMPEKDENPMMEFRTALRQARRDDMDGGTVFFLNEGRPCMRRTGPDLGARSGPVAFDNWRMLALSDSDARRLAADLDAVLERYSGRRSGKRTYLIHAGLAPRAA